MLNSGPTKVETSMLIHFSSISMTLTGPMMYLGLRMMGLRLDSGVHALTLEMATRQAARLTF
jgi:hypothetical protein